MIYLALFLLLTNLVSEFSVTGRRLEMSQHPFMLRLRWFGAGMALALIGAGYDWKTGWVGWAAVAVLLVGSVRHFSATQARGAGSSDDSPAKPVA